MFLNSRHKKKTKVTSPGFKILGLPLTSCPCRVSTRSLFFFFFFFILRKWNNGICNLEHNGGHVIEQNDGQGCRYTSKFSNIIVLTP